MTGTGLEVRYTINEGISLWDGKCGVLIDYLFDNEEPSWSDMPDLCKHHMAAKTGEFGREHILLFTHRHCDHYSGRYVKEYLEHYQTPVLLGIGIAESNVAVRAPQPGVGLFTHGDYRAVFLEAKHQGKGKIADVPNTVLCVGHGDEWYAHLGDSVLTEELVATMRGQGIENIRAVFSNMYHIIPEDQRGLLASMKAEHVYCIHFPFRQDDICHIHRQITRHIERTDDPFLKTVVVPEPMSRLL